MPVRFFTVWRNFNIVNFREMRDLQELRLRLVFGFPRDVWNHRDVVVVNSELGKKGGHADKNEEIIYIEKPTPTKPKPVSLKGHIKNA